MRGQSCLGVVFLLLAGCAGPAAPGAVWESSAEPEGDNGLEMESGRTHSSVFTFQVQLGHAGNGPATGRHAIEMNHTGAPFAARLELRSAQWQVWAWNATVCHEHEAARLRCQQGLLDGGSGPGYVAISPRNQSHVILDGDELARLGCNGPCEVLLARPPDDRSPVKAAWSWFFGNPQDVDMGPFQWHPPSQGI